MDPAVIAAFSVIGVWMYAMLYIVTNRAAAIPFKALLWKILRIGRGR